MAYAVSAIPPAVHGARDEAHTGEFRVVSGDKGVSAVDAFINVQPVPGSEEGLDHWIEEDGKTFAGRHLIIDLWGAERLDEVEHMESALRDAVDAAGATLLHIHLHHFTPNGGVSGVAVLAESHISVHSWPERNYAAFDVFMCGDAKPAAAIPVLEKAFKPSRVNVGTFHRGDAQPEWVEQPVAEAAE